MADYVAAVGWSGNESRRGIRNANTKRCSNLGWLQDAAARRQNWTALQGSSGFGWGVKENWTTGQAQGGLVLQVGAARLLAFSAHTSSGYFEARRVSGYFATLQNNRGHRVPPYRIAAQKTWTTTQAPPMTWGAETIRVTALRGSEQLDLVWSTMATP
ncbi:hypothetical protein VTI74DRAFT_8640 [Chaetomium olivicolor]